MPIHINNSDVEELVEQYRARLGTTKTEAIRRALVLALDEPERKSARSKVLQTGLAIIARARVQKREPWTKQDSDALFDYLETEGSAKRIDR